MATALTTQSVLERRVRHDPRGFPSTCLVAGCKLCARLRNNELWGGISHLKSVFGAGALPLYMSWELETDFPIPGKNSTNIRPFSTRPVRYRLIIFAFFSQFPTWRSTLDMHAECVAVFPTLARVLTPKHRKGTSI